MFGVQKVIKYLALALALLIVCGVFSAFVGAGMFFSYVTDDGSMADIPEWTEVISIGEIEGEVKVLNLDLKTTSVEIKSGEKFEVRAHSEIIEARKSGDIVYLQEKAFSFWRDWGSRKGKMTVTIPEGKVRELHVSAGAGQLRIEGIEAEEMNLGLGAGRTELSKVVATRRMTVSGGAGLLAIKGATLANLDLDMGVGKVELEAKLTGKNEIDAGVGKLEMGLVGSTDDYKIRMDKGIGAITLNGESMGDDSTWGNGVTVVDVDGGVGAIEIEVTE